VWALTRRQTSQDLSDETHDGLRNGDPHALVEQKLVSAQNWMVSQRQAYNRSLMYRAQCIALAQAAGWSKYRIAQRLGITRRAVDEALERPRSSPLEFMESEIGKNGGFVSLGDQLLKELLIERGKADGEQASR
jgi:hypothetical protein